MAYDPFARGPFPAGVRTALLRDAARDERFLPIEVWYPADDAHAGADVNPETCDGYELVPGLPKVHQSAVRDAAPRAGRFPVVVFSHGFGGHRRQSTFLCSHLASHGYVVASCDHTGNTMLDVMRMAMAQRSGNAATMDAREILPNFIALRPADARFTLDRVLDGAAGGLADHVDATRVGMTGHSFGGWTTLMMIRHDARVRAALPLAPAGGVTFLPSEELQKALDWQWGREVPTLFVVADRDSLLPLDGMHGLLEKTPSATKHMDVLENTDHMHFCDRAGEVHELFRMMPPPGAFEEAARRCPPISELTSPAQAELAIRGLATAHFDAVLRDDAGAKALAASGWDRVLAAQGVAATVIG